MFVVRVWWGMSDGGWFMRRRVSGMCVWGCDVVRS